MTNMVNHYGFRPSVYFIDHAVIPNANPIISLRAPQLTVWQWEGITRKRFHCFDDPWDMLWIELAQISLG